MNKEEVLKLARLARIKLEDKEAESLTHEFEAILNYVSEVKRVSSTANAQTQVNFSTHNVLRDDIVSHESGEYTEKILSQAPSREGEYVKVKKIL